MLSLSARAIIITLLLALLRHLLLLQRQVEVAAMQRARGARARRSHAALVTLADPRFAACALALVRSARAHGWRGAVVVLAVEHGRFPRGVARALDKVGVLVVHTNAVLDWWLRRGVENVDVFRGLQARKFRKMELFLNPVLRGFERLVFMDADGVVKASLEPLLRVAFPPNVTVLMRQNDGSMGKGGFWANEMAVEALTERQAGELARRFPDREMTGASCWMVVDVRRLESPTRILERSLELLCSFRAGFRLNDQTLIGLLFYERMMIFPWCVWDEMPVVTGSKQLAEYCRKHMHLQRWLKGGLRFMYRHLSVKEKQQCVASGEQDDGRIAGEEVGRIAVAGLKTVRGEAECLTALRVWRRRLTRVDKGDVVRKRRVA